MITVMCLLPPLMCVQAMLFLMVYKILGLSAKASPLQLNGLLLMMIFAAPLHANLTMAIGSMPMQFLLEGDRLVAPFRVLLGEVDVEIIPKSFEVL